MLLIYIIQSGPQSSSDHNSVCG